MTQTGTPSGWQDYTELEKLTRALADKVRLNIVRILASSQQEVNVTDLTQQLLISQPLVSWHLAILRRNGLVRTRRQGRQVYCSLDAARCQQCLQWLGAVVSGESSLHASASPATGSAPTPNTSGATGATGATGAAAPSAKSGKPADARPAKQF